ncbi:MAG: HlyD family efflux transporter periplasmic adaptor subunit [Moorella humiferrea]|nr:HlyD family efflux transporter periplasmic adaptor subunit [Moorella humiferrea]
MTVETVPVTPPRFRKVRWLLGGCIFLLLVGALLWWQYGRRAEVKYIAVPVAQGSIKNAINATGTIEPVKSVNLGFKNSGIIKAIYVKPGDAVKAGQVLAVQDTAELEAQLAQAQASYNSAVAKLQLLEAGPLPTDIAQAEANVEAARVAYNNAQATVERDQSLYQAGALAKADLDSAVANRDTAAAKLRQAEASLEALKNGNRPEDIAAARAQVDAARVQVDLARNNLDSAQLRAPWDGIISAVNGEVGYRVGSSTDNSNSSFITMITPTLQLRAKVNEADINKVKVGQEVSFTVNAIPGKEMRGKVAWIAPEAQTVSNVQLYDVVISLDPEPSLKAGMTASVDFILDRKDNVLTIPEAALTFARTYLAGSGRNGGRSGTAAGGDRNTSGGRTVQGSVPGTTANDSSGAGRREAGAGGEGTGRATVLVLENGRPVPRQIVTGASDESNVEVVSGLAAGEAVVVGTSTSARTSSSTQTRSFMGPGPVPFRQPARTTTGR